MNFSTPLETTNIKCQVERSQNLLIKMNIEIRNMNPQDWQAVSKIYKIGIDTGNATFETNVPTWQHWNNAHAKSCRLIAIKNNSIVGWAALSPVSNRCVYGGVAEVSVYVDIAQTGKGIGSKLLENLIYESEKAGFWTLQSGIFPENSASIRIHKKLGFREIGYRERIGKIDNTWRNNIILERRSKTIGIN